MLAGADVAADGDAAASDADWAQVVAGPWLAETLKGLRSPEGLARIDPGARSERHAAALPAGGRALALSARQARPRSLPRRRHGAGQDHPGARRCCWCCEEQEPRRHGSQACWSRRPRCSPTGPSEIERFAPSLKALIAHPSALPAAELKTLAPERLAGCRSGDHELRLAAAHSMARGSLLAPGRARRSAGHQESRSQADPGGQEAEGAGAVRAHRHAGREPARRPLVHLRFHQSRAARIGEGVLELREAPGGAAPQSVRLRCANWCGPTSCGA